MAKDNSKDLRAHGHHDRFWTGFILLIIGAALLAQKMGMALPGWLFTWPMILVAIGLISGLKHGFRNPSWLIMVGLGAFFLSDEIITDINIKPYFWPVMIMVLGLLFILRPKKKWHYRADKWTNDRWTEDDLSGMNKAYERSSTEDVLDSVSIFGGVKKVITSKDFKGGDIVCFMGGAEINLSQADITEPVTLEIFQAFGGTKLVVPPHWEIRSEAVAIFAGIEDKRPPQPGSFDPRKILILKGTTVFGGIDIRSF